MRHEKFGDGVIVDIEGSGDKAEAVVRFPDVGEKRLLLAWAPLAARLSRGRRRYVDELAGGTPVEVDDDGVDLVVGDDAHGILLRAVVDVHRPASRTRTSRGGA